MNSFKILLLAFVFISIGNACTPRSQETSDTSFTNWAICSVQGSIYGSVFMREGGNGTEFRVKLAGLPSGIASHGFHVHQYGNLFTTDLEGTCKGAAGHYNPENQNHGSPNDPIRHVGDLGNVCADENGEVDEVFVDTVALLTGNNSILAKAIVVHAGADDLTSQPTGAAGSRLGCCVIGDMPEWQVEDVQIGFHDISSMSHGSSSIYRIQTLLMPILFCVSIMSKLF